MEKCTKISAQDIRAKIAAVFLLYGAEKCFFVNRSSSDNTQKNFFLKADNLPLTLTR